MSRIQILKLLVNERLTTAVEEIFGVFERTIEEYEGEIYRQRQLLEYLEAEMKLHKTDPPQLLVCEDEVPPEQQERSPSLNQEEPEFLQMKEERQELWTSQEGEPLQGLEEADIIKLTSTPVPVKSECEEKLRSSWLNQTQTEENREAEPLASTSTEQMKTEPDGEDCRVSEPPSNLDLEPSQLLSSDCSGTETDGSDDDGKPQSGLNTLEFQQTQTAEGQSLSNSNRFERPMELSHELKSTNQILSAPCCKVCGQSFPKKISLMRHVKVHPRDCGLCGKHLEPAESFKLHLQAHSTCNICSKIFVSIADLEKHVRTHTGEKPFSCSICGETYGRKDNLKVHMRVHTGEKPYSCPYCGKRFTRNGHRKNHERLHTGEKPYSCSGCGKNFNQMLLLKRHKCSTKSVNSYAMLLD